MVSRVSEIGPFPQENVRATVLPHLPVVVVIKAVEESPEMARWCKDRWGAQGLRVNQLAIRDRASRLTYMFDPSAHWARRLTTYYFRDPDHAFEFKMRWA